MQELPQIVPDLAIELDPLAITQVMFQGRSSNPDWAERVGAIIQTVQPMLTPGVVSRWLTLTQTREREVVLQDPDSQESVTLEIGEHAKELASASRVLCCVGTLGSGFDLAMAKVQDTGDMLESYLADCAGIYGLLQVSRAVYREVEAVAAGLHWGVGRVLCPGAIEGWPLEAQHALCAMLPLERCGVQLNEFGVLSPGKSVSFLLGIGPGYTARQVMSPCDICTNTGECWCNA